MDSSGKMSGKVSHRGRSRKRKGRGQILLPDGAVGLTQLRRMLPEILEGGRSFRGEVWDYGERRGVIVIERVGP